MTEFKQQAQDFSKGSNQDKVGAIGMVLAGFAFPVTWGSEAHSGAWTVKVIEALPLDQLLNNPALLGVGCFLAGLPIFGVIRGLEKFGSSSGAVVGAAVSSLITIALFWAPYLNFPGF